MNAFNHLMEIRGIQGKLLKFSGLKWDDGNNLFEALCFGKNLVY